ncbi:MAG: cupin domain-containing protein [Candidatus Bathyarchaeia archaeon]
MEYKDTDDVMVFSKEKMQKIELFSSDKLLCDLYCLEPGQYQKHHKHEGSDKVYYVKKGEVVVTLDSHEKQLHEGCAILAPAGIEHSIRNTSGERAVLLVLLAPRPEH